MGQSSPPKLADVTGELFWDDMNVKVLGYLRCARAVAPLMVDQGWGRIINISGLGARTDRRGHRLDAQRRGGGDDQEPRRRARARRHQRDRGPPRPDPHRGDARRRSPGRPARGISPEEAEASLVRNSIRRIVDATEVADVVAFLASPRSSAITGDAITSTAPSSTALYQARLPAWQEALDGGRRPPRGLAHSTEGSA